jgi:heat shock protein 5
VILCEDAFFDVLSGDSHLGGQDMDQRVADHFVEVIKQKHGRDITDDSRKLNRLRRECERAKRVLSDQPQARVEIEALFDGVHFSELLTRAQFEELNEDLLLKTMAQLEKAVADAGLDKREIDEIILMGGSARIPKVQQLVRAYFDGKEPLSGINPDEAMAYGAAVQGSYLATPDVEEPLMFRT